MFTLDVATTHAALDVCALFDRPQVTVTVDDDRMCLHAGTDDCNVAFALLGAGDTSMSVTVAAHALRRWLTGESVSGHADRTALRRSDGQALAAVACQRPVLAPPAALEHHVHPQELAAALTTVLHAAPAHAPGRVWIGDDGILLAAGPVIAWAPCPDLHAVFSCSLASARVLERLAAAEAQILAAGTGQFHGCRWSLWQTASTPRAPEHPTSAPTWEGQLHSRALLELAPERLPRRTFTLAGDVATICGEVMCARGNGHAKLRVDVTTLKRFARALGPGMIDVAAGDRSLQLRSGRAWIRYQL